MQKRRKSRIKPSDEWNFNTKLETACRSLVKSLGERVPGGTFGSDYLRTEYLSKFNGKGSVSASERREAAIRKWRDVELTNAETNRRLRGRDRGYNLLPRITFYRFLEVCQHLISEVLGPLDDSVVMGTFTGGASTSRKRTDSHPAEKFCGLADATQGASPYVELVIRQSELYRQYQFMHFTNDVHGADLFTVPKKTEIDRCACKEPDVNMFLQKGVGLHIRRRLRRVGINLNDQSINRSLAKRGSIDGTLATLDLSSASDTVTQSLVLALLPHDWYLYLNDIRSTMVKVEGVYSETEMFSSMGNGFTFELESLIFWAIAKSTAYLRGVSGIISVYGDDIIVPTGMYHDLVWVLAEFGFSVNPSKSFHEGSFRESCGGHYDFGNDVTPFYLKREPTHLTDVIRVANQLRRWSMADPARVYEVPGLFDLWKELADFVPKDLWGGSDTALDTQLASPCPPRSRLVRVTGEKKVPELGRYLHWHTTNWNRSWEIEDESLPPLRTAHRCRKRAATPGVLAYELYFPEEV